MFRLLLLATCVLGAASVFAQTAPLPNESLDRRLRRTALEIEQKTKRRKQPAKTPAKDQNDELLRVETNLVLNYVTVVDPKGNLVTDLNKDDFQIWDQGVLQTIDEFTSATVSKPRSIVLVLDNDWVQLPYRDLSLGAARDLVNRLLPTDRLAIVTLPVTVQTDFSSDKAHLKRVLDSITWFDGNPDTYRRLFESFSLDAKDKKKTPAEVEEDKVAIGYGGVRTLGAVLTSAFQSEENREKVVVVQGDPNETIWLKDDADMPFKISYAALLDSGLRYGNHTPIAFGFNDIRRIIESSDATVYTIVTGHRIFGLEKNAQREAAKQNVIDFHRAIGGKEKEIPFFVDRFWRRNAELGFATQAAMVKLAEWSGGMSGFVETPGEAERIYGEIFTVMNNRYAIGFYPDEKNRSASRRELKITVKNHPEYKVTHRPGYYF